MASLLRLRCDWGNRCTSSLDISHYILGSLTFLKLGKAFGFLGKGSDISGIMPAIHEFARYGAVIGVLHEWHPMIFRLLQMIAPSGSQGLAYIAQFTAQAIAECSQRATPHDTHGNLLSSMYAMHQKDPEAFKLQDIHYHSIPNIAAGSDTTATTLSAVLYFLCKVPRTLDVLRCELDERRKKGQFSELITFKEAQGCPYLQAVLKETLRLHPGNGLPMPRVVPKGGMTLAGRFFPEAVRSISLPLELTDPIARQDHCPNQLLGSSLQSRCLRTGCR